MSRYLVNIDGNEYDIEVEYRSEAYVVTLNGRRLSVTSHRLGETRQVLLINGRAYEVDVRSDDYEGRKTVFMRGVEILAQVEDYNLAQLRKTAGMTSGPTVEKTLKAPMPGLVLEIKVAPGDTVASGQTLLVVEAMKMENVIKAKAPATIKSVHVACGASVEKDDKLLEFE